MPKQELTGEFSICLTPTEDVISDVDSIRLHLPESPYRDDEPHVTLLRGITTADEMTDEQLASRIGGLLPLDESLPVPVCFKTLMDGSNQRYKTTTLMMFAQSREYGALRRKVVRGLEADGFDIERKAKISAQFPHLTVRLGVLLGGEQRAQANDLFRGRTVKLADWFLYRVYYEDDRRLVRKVSPVK